MKTLLPLLFLLSSQIYATEFDGYYVGLRGDTVRCQFDIPTTKSGEIAYSTIEKVVKMASEKKKKPQLKAGQIREFFIEGDHNVKFVSVKLHDEYTFLMEENKGKLLLYKHFFIDDAGSSLVHFVVQAPFRRPSELTPIRFRKQLLKYTEDDPFFTSKFHDKSWKYDMLDQLIASYNDQIADQD